MPVSVASVKFVGRYVNDGQGFAGPRPKVGPGPETLSVSGEKRVNATFIAENMVKNMSKIF